MGIEAIASFFDRRAPTYDAMVIHQWMARRLVEVVAPSPGARVLDVATGTGLAARAAARAVENRGRVVGVDISSGMLAEAQRKVKEEELGNVEFLVAPADALPFADASFDVVLCVAAIPFFPSASAAIREWQRLLGSGGTLGFTGLEEDPIASHRVLRAVARREAGITVVDPHAELGTKDRAVRALESAGFENVAVLTEPFKQPFAAPETAWETTVQHPLSAPLRELSTDALERVRTVFLEEYGALYSREAEDTVRNFLVTARRA